MDDEFHYPDQLEIQPFAARGVAATVTVPGSKSITNRALVLAALASRNGPCTLTGALQSEDTEVMIDSLQRLGFKIEADWENFIIRVGKNKSGRVIPAETAELFVANSGTTMRFLTAAVSIGRGRYRLDGVARMRERPIRDLLDALTQLQVGAESEFENGCPPVIVHTNGWRTPDRDPIPGTLHMHSNVSSQFLSGLMLAAPFAAQTGLAIVFDENQVSRPYLDMTDALIARMEHQYIIRR